jgi:hypothetical protein
VPARASLWCGSADVNPPFADPSRELGSVVEDVARIGARPLLQSALEAEVTAFLGWERFQRNGVRGSSCKYLGRVIPRLVLVK